MAYGVIAGQGTGTSSGRGVAVDGAGNTHVTGYFGGTVDFDPGPGTVQFASADWQDHFVAKYDAAGNLLWAKSAGSSTSYEYGHGIAVDGAGNAYVTGHFSGTVDFDPGPGTALLVSTAGDHFVAKYDADGNLLWAKSAGSSTGAEYGRGIAVDGAGNAHVTGQFEGMVNFDPGPGSATVSSGPAAKHFTSAPGPTRRALTARPSASSSPPCANGPTPSPSKAPPNAATPCDHGSTATTTPDPTPLSAVDLP